MLRAVLNKSWRQHPTRHQLYGHLPPITKTIQVRRTRHVGHCWRSKDELISDVLLWTPTYGCAKAGRPARTYIQQLCEDTGMVNLKTCRRRWMIGRSGERGVRDICAGGATWWWWWWCVIKAMKNQLETEYFFLTSKYYEMTILWSLLSYISGSELYTQRISKYECDVVCI